MKKIILFGSMITLAGFLAACNSQPTVQSTVTPTQQITQTETATPTAETTVKVEIKMTDSGFEPKTSTVKAGTTVTFTNTGKDDHWVASAPHPQHTDLPGFDALKAIKPGESYEFTFEKVGTWKFHDHLNTSLFGSITVE